MKKLWKAYAWTILILICLLIPFDAFGQSSDDFWKDKRKIHHYFYKIQGGVEWTEINQYLNDSLPYYNSYLSDILNVKLFLDTIVPRNKVDSLFVKYCSMGHQYFPFHASGRLSLDMYHELDIDTSSLYYIMNGPDYKGDYSELVDINSKSTNELLPQIIPYLDNDAITRIVIFPQTDLFQMPICLKISDVAIGLIELASKCDFHDSNSFRYKHYSKEPEEVRQTIKANIKNWFIKTYDLPEIERIAFFLDSIPIGYKEYLNTCKNMIFLKDSVFVIPYLIRYYQKTKHAEAGKLMLIVGNNQFVFDCLERIKNSAVITNDPFTGSLLDCINVVMKEGHTNDVDIQFSKSILKRFDVVGNGPEQGNQMLWQSILYYLPSYVNSVPNTLVQFLKIKTTLTELPDQKGIYWQSRYKAEINDKYRVCDLALQIYDRTVERVNIINWSSLENRDVAIKQILQKNDQ